MGFLEPIQEQLGGGTASLWLIGGGIVVAWLALKAAKMVFRMAFLAVGAAMFLGAAPWSGAAGVEGQVADCTVAIVISSMDTWQTTIAKRITVEQVTDDARCAGEEGLSAGAAEVRLRTVYDIPFQTWDVSPEGASPRGFDIPEFDTNRLFGGSDQPSDDATE